jgi:hypothetical protein
VLTEVWGLLADGFPQNPPANFPRVCHAIDMMLELDNTNGRSYLFTRRGK